MMSRTPKGFTNAAARSSEPGECGHVRFPHDALEDDVHELAAAGDADQATGFQFLQVVRESRRRDWKCAAQIRTGRRGACRNFLENLEAPRIRQRTRDRLAAARRHARCGHRVTITGKEPLVSTNHRAWNRDAPVHAE